MPIDLIEKYFSLSPHQKNQFNDFGNVFKKWNEKINLVSRKDIPNLYLHHILYSLSIAKLINFKPATLIADIGTGGGFPGLPLAIMFPDSDFLLVDSVSKKIHTVKEIAGTMGLSNVHTSNERAEKLEVKVDFVTGRAVGDLSSFYHSTLPLIRKQCHNPLPNGILYLKGGDISTEKQHFNQKLKVFPVSKWFEEDFFMTKAIVYISCTDSSKE